MSKERILSRILDKQAASFSDMTAVVWLEKRKQVERSYSELDIMRKKVSRALGQNGLSGIHASLIGRSSFDWIASYLGIVSSKNVAVPLDASLPDEELISLINRSDSVILFLDLNRKALIPSLIKACPLLKSIVLLCAGDSVEEVNTIRNSVKEVSIVTLDSFVSSVGEMGESCGNVPDEDLPSEDDVCTIIYTSGTTGLSKGVMLTQRNLYDNVDAVVENSPPGTRMLTVLPIHHAFCLCMDWLKGLSLGACICINDSLLHMIKNIGVFKPDIMLMVPLMIETVYKRLQAVGPEKSKGDAKRELLGENLHRIYSGGAHLDPSYIDAMREYGIEICEGYGMSECSPVISSNGDLGNKPGSVGLPLKNAEISFSEGEILVKGSSVMQGYYKMPKETDETLRDGWLHTGDLGHIDAEGFLYITGRLKNLIILSNGENISPEEVEGHFAINPYVGEIIVTGEGNGLTARIYPDYEYAKHEGLTEEGIRERLQELIDDYNKTQPTYRAITALVIRKNPFQKSTTRKIKRALADVDEPE